MRFAIRHPATHVVGAVAAIAVVAHLASLQPNLVARLEDTRRPWSRDGVYTGTLLRRAFAGRRPLVAVEAAGTLPYFSRLPCLDMLGLTDRYIATHPPEDFGRGWPGHELGNGAYVWSRQPDLVVFGNHVGLNRGAWRGARELHAMRQFRERYRMVTLEAEDGTRVLVFARTEGGRTGVQRGPGRIEIPGFLFSGPTIVSRLDSSDRLAVALVRGRSAHLQIEVGSGRWRVQVDSDVPVQWSASGARREGDLLVVDAPPPGPVTLSLTVETSAMVRSVTLLRRR